MKITLTQAEANVICRDYISARFQDVDIEIEIDLVAADPESLGPGWFNPINLTPEQVGVSEGWRLLTVDEVSDHSREYPDTQWYRLGEWQRTATWNASLQGDCTLRTKHPIGYYKR